MCYEQKLKHFRNCFGKENSPATTADDIIILILLNNFLTLGIWNTVQARKSILWYRKVDDLSDYLAQNQLLPHSHYRCLFEVLPDWSSTQKLIVKPIHTFFNYHSTDLIWKFYNTQKHQNKNWSVSVFYLHLRAAEVLCTRAGQS